MAKSVLITGLTGFLGSHIARAAVNKKYKITAIIRPCKNYQKIAEFSENCEFVEIDLSDTFALKNFLSDKSYDHILHFGAIRGGRKFSKKDYYSVNVDATTQLVINAKKNNSKFIFCSSVGVFGAIPKELPANNRTPKQNDNYYHYTKNIAEATIQQHVLSGLNAVIIRPSITYGKGDYGFPYTLIKLIDYKLLLVPDKMIMIHLTNVDLVTEFTLKLMETDVKSGSTYIIADKQAVVFSDLVNKISRELHGKDYPESRKVFRDFFKKAEKLAIFCKSDLWKARIQLISKSWFYDVDGIYNDFYLRHAKTLNDFDNVINWYKTLRKK